MYKVKLSLYLLLAFFILLIPESVAQTGDPVDSMKGSIEDGIWSYEEEEDGESIFGEPFIEDSTKVNLESFNQSSLDQYKQNAEFVYGPDPNNEGFFSRLKRLIISKFMELIGAENQNALFKLITWLVIGGGLFFIIRALMDSTGFNLFRKEEKISDLPINLTEEELKQDLQLLVTTALATKDYRLALRYQFLHLLKRLDGEEMIQFKSYKTNRDYYYEISDSRLKQKFAKAAQVYEYAWYGEFEVTTEIYENAMLDFNLFNISNQN